MRKLILTLCLLLSTSAHAEFYMAREFSSDMRKTDQQNTIMTQGYIMGVYDSTIGILHCPTSEVTGYMARQVAAIGVAGADRSTTANVAIARAFMKAWPCQGSM